MKTDQKQQQEYAGRINRAMDYVQEHLFEELSLEAVAKAAGFSKYHFHRIFSCFCGETLNHFVKRVRVERAAWQLTGNPNKSVTEIAFDCGFSGSAAFARSFKEIMGVSASEWRDGGAIARKNGKTKSNICKADGNLRKEFEITMDENGWQSKKPTWRIQMKKEHKNMDTSCMIDAKVEVKEMPEYKVVYVRHVGAYQGDGALFGQLIGKLCSWAGPRGLLKESSRMLMVYHDDPNITDDEKLRLDVCLTVDGDVDVSGDIGSATIPGGQFAVGHFEIDQDQYVDAWDTVMGGFLAKGEYQPDDRLCYEMCLNDPQTHPEHKHIVDICVPVRPM
ncbi:MAG: AraC family transcriptional regulator [Deltaproteobacteria bacterium]|nr:AraC family transcriptional regulator [Deltaproteobacteria bacterium]